MGKTIFVRANVLQLASGVVIDMIPGLKNVLEFVNRGGKMDRPSAFGYDNRVVRNSRVGKPTLNSINRLISGLEKLHNLLSSVMLSKIGRVRVRTTCQL